MTLVVNRNDGIVATDVRVTGGSSGTTDQVSIQSDVTQIVGRNDRRFGLLIENIGSVTVEIGFTNALVMGKGHPLAVGAARVLETTSDLYGVVASTAGLLAYTEQVS